MASVTNRILWWSLVVSLLIYVVVAHVASVRPRSDAPISELSIVFAVLSVGVGIGTLVYRRHALAGPIQRGELDPTSTEGRVRAFQPFMLNLVLSESVGIYGLVLAFLSGEGALSIPFVAGALVLMLLHRPTAPDLVPPPGGAFPGGRPPPIA